MATPPRYFQKGSYYHVYNRGNRKQPIFLNSKDYTRFIEKVSEYKENFPLTVESYCLMPNHYHMLIRQDSFVPLTSFMLRLGTSYSKYFNIKYDLTGSLFQGPFKAKKVDSDEYLLHLTRYIHRNPISILKPHVSLRNYPWSSYSAFLNGQANDIVNPTYTLSFFSKQNPDLNYKHFVEYEAFDRFNPSG